MAYNAVAQVDEELGLESPRSPSLRSGYQRLDEVGHADNTGSGRDLSSIIRSLSSTSYDLVEDDDYGDDLDLADSPVVNAAPRRHIPPLDTTEATLHASSLPLRSPSSDDYEPVPLSHPTPDLQSLQGAYVGNVERLERSAERLSLSSVNLAQGIRKMDLEQKQNSASSVCNSAASPRGSIMSTSRLQLAVGSRLAQVDEPGHEEDTYAVQSPVPVRSLVPVPYELEQNHHHPHRYNYYQHHQVAAPADSSQDDRDPVMEQEEYYDRPHSAASGDTYQQARTLFRDFDGVHFIPQSQMESVRRVPLTKPPLASASESHKEPRRGENMVYYPAPVPKMLNLPPRLSRKPANDWEKRRTQVFGPAAPPLVEQKKSAAVEQNKEAIEDRRSKRYSKIPSQLRASVFFEIPSAQLDLQVKQASAVATLESILDASASAPVTAFTDHPFAGHVGREVYGSSRPKSSSNALVTEKKRRPKSQGTMGLCHSSSAGDLRDVPLDVDDHFAQTEAEAAGDDEGSALRGSHDADNYHDDRSDRSHADELDESSHANEEDNPEAEEEDDNDSEDDLAFVGQPNTLLAELELRKKQLQQRRRTVILGEGLQSTLLELDAVAQKQSERRRRRPVTLAWESPDLRHQEGEDDDVPLAILYPDKAPGGDESRPLGLMERKEMEESEPLSRRRARLRGDVSPTKRPATMHSMEVPPVAALSDSGDEEETLAQRLKRLRGKDGPSTATGSDFTSEVLAELTSRTDSDSRQDRNSGNVAAAPGEEEAEEQEEETLAQRRNRLATESKTATITTTTIPPSLPLTGQKAIKERRSMAAIPQTHPTVLGRQSSHDLLLSQPTRGSRHPYQQPQYGGSRMSMYQLPTTFSQPVGGPYTPQYPGYHMANPYGYAAGGYHYHEPQPLGMGGLGGMGYTPAIDPGQRDVIDRWRQSIR
ncbi:hypothetical protein ASPZODRAFT_129883 [Penicilliopsis zonata CBS 506.65]|uniref:Uncharacterized protein n=1 Tax=Penicilliopsis zonata CBS 506.65 TaxID=1073090 RepID=A0A1L9SQQ3_9EURO|nr:hypothetical protein ASPZODRAFT_129883 [Penicilliopsis zonata CBS 506.65]OJJ49424.1 hypothetical protein ASPZODRAFT_129883 [Penicilliopsis zonata CBS 506.65]